MVISKNLVVRYFWIIIGILLSIIGLIGIILPGLPTTPVMILAAACFFRSSKKLYTWVIKNKYFGQHVKNFRDYKGIPKKVKLMIITWMWIFVLISVLFGIPDNFLWAKVLASLAAITGTVYIITLRTI
ncbi:MAG: hypothetical protein CMG69_00205 [Candidatus Marinimicrobia bacterium]|nr:hypothetical protein [Candidatus Neomarinimicrobiota bacterium]|tara:strand:+ start:108 stop:494 length:387 start_codon:yes stop_codon:yes gene_type:complete